MSAPLPGITIRIQIDTVGRKGGDEGERESMEGPRSLTRPVLYAMAEISIPETLIHTAKITGCNRFFLPPNLPTPHLISFWTFLHWSVRPTALVYAL